MEATPYMKTVLSEKRFVTVFKTERFMTVFRISQKLLSLLDIHVETMGFEVGAFFSLGSKARNYGWGVMKNLRMMKFQ